MVPFQQNIKGCLRDIYALKTIVVNASYDVSLLVIRQRPKTIRDKSQVTTGLVVQIFSKSRKKWAIEIGILIPLYLTRITTVSYRLRRLLKQLFPIQSVQTTDKCEGR